MSRREVLVALLENYLEVLPGLRDSEGGDGTGTFASSIWQTPQYRELEKLRLRLRAEEPRLYWHLAETYFRCQERRVMRCTHSVEGRRCPHAVPVVSYQRARTLPVHVHSGRRYKLTPALVKVVSPKVDALLVGEAIEWLLERWPTSTRLESPVPVAA